MTRNGMLDALYAIGDWVERVTDWSYLDSMGDYDDRPKLVQRLQADLEKRQRP